MPKKSELEEIGQPVLPNSLKMSTVFETQLTWLASKEKSELSDDDDGLVLAGWVAVVASWERVDAARKVAKAAHARAAHARAKYWAMGVVVVARRAGAERVVAVAAAPETEAHVRVVAVAAIIRMAQSWAARRIQAVARGRALRAWKVRFADIGGLALVHLLRRNYSIYLFFTTGGGARLL
jgi:hypothetical protein